NLQQSARLSQGKNGIEPDIVADIQQGNAAVGLSHTQVGEQRDLGSGASGGYGVTHEHPLRCAAKGGNRRRTHAGCAADGGRTVAPTKAELSTDLAGKAAGSGHYTSFDFDFLRLAIKLGQQTIDRRNRRRDVLND